MDPVFDEDGVPFSPNPTMYRMWMQHHYQKQKEEEAQQQNFPTDEDAIEKDVGNLSLHQKEKQRRFPGFEYRPCPTGAGGDVVYDNGSGSLTPATGTWILNDRDELVSGPVPLASTNHSPASQTQMKQLQVPPFSIPLEMRSKRIGSCGSMGDDAYCDDINGKGGEKRMRNRCYSDAHVRV